MRPRICRLGRQRACHAAKRRAVSAGSSFTREGRGSGGVLHNLNLSYPMNMPPLGSVVGACLFATLLPAASAQLITQWNFNSANADGSTSTGSVLPSWGVGTASAIGGVSNGFAAGSPRDSVADNSAWNLGRWPAQGTASGTAGAQFMVSTAGFFGAIEIAFDLRQTTTASERYQLQVTADGMNFVNVSGGTGSFGTAGNNSATAFGADGLYINTAANSSQAFVQEILYSFSPDSDYDDNANFGFRLVSVFDGAAYDAAGASANYGTGGSLRLDLVSVSVMPATAAVPEPATNAFLLGAGALAAVVYRRRRLQRSKIEL